MLGHLTCDILGKPHILSLFRNKFNKFNNINNMKFVNPLLAGHSEMGASANSEDPWMNCRKEERTGCFVYCVGFMLVLRL